MKSSTIRWAGLALAMLVAALAGGQAFAERPSWADDSRRHNVRADDRRDYRRDDRRYDRRSDRRDERRVAIHNRNDYWQSRNIRFHDDMRARIDVYYDGHFRRGRCPPGLVKKRNGCAPIHQTRRWERGRPLPRDVVYAPLPHDLVIQLPPPPLHHEYVRVASDILLIATGTSMVVDAIQDIGQRR